MSVTETDAAETQDDVVLTVTEPAIAKILELRQSEDDPAGLALRIAVTGIRGPEYTYDLTFEPMAEAEDTDLLYHQGELPVLVPADSMDSLQGATLDLPSTDGGGGLVLRNPNRPDPLAGVELDLHGTVAEQVQQPPSRRPSPRSPRSSTSPTTTPARTPTTRSDQAASGDLTGRIVRFGRPIRYM